MVTVVLCADSVAPAQLKASLHQEEKKTMSVWDQGRNPSFFRHPQDAEQAATNFDKMPADKFKAVVNKLAQSNQDREAEAITRADAYSFQIANPQFKRTDKNTRVMNHQLTSWGITNPVYEDFARAYDTLNGAGLLDIDERVTTPKTFTGIFSKQTFNNVEDLVLMERDAARKSILVSPEEIALENMPIDDFKTLVKSRERDEQRQADGYKTGIAGDAWLTQHPEFSDTHFNAKLMRQQLANNGVLEGAATIADYETAYQQLRGSGLLSLNKVAVNKQHQETLRQEASEALQAEPTEEEMYAMPMAELEKRARGW